MATKRLKRFYRHEFFYRGLTRIYTDFIWPRKGKKSTNFRHGFTQDLHGFKLGLREFIDRMTGQVTQDLHGICLSHKGHGSAMLTAGRDFLDRITGLTCYH